MRHVAAAAALVALIALVYGASLGNQFVFDDHSLVVENELVQLPLARAYALLAPGAAGISYRPLRIFSYMVDYRIAGGLDPVIFHASNLAYHAAATLAVYALAWLTIGTFGGALAAAAIFAVHPLGSEAVVYVAGRRDLLSTLFVLLALLCWCRLIAPTRAASFERSGGRSRGGAGRVALLVAMVLCAMLAMAAKEMAVVLPVLAVLLAIPLRRDQRRRGDLSSAGSALAASVVALLVVGGWLYGDVLAASLRAAGDGALAPQPALSLRVLGRYLLLAVWPARLLADYRAHAFVMPAAAIDGPAVIAALALGSLLVAGVVLLWRGSIAGAGLLWFLVALLPVAQIVPYKEVVSEHNAYLALAGLALAVGRITAVAARTRPRLATAAVVALVLLLGLRSHVRARDWRDSLSLWQATVATAPASVRGQYNLGVAILGEGDLLGARAALERAHELAPDDRDVLLTLATLYGRLGEYDTAERLAMRAIELQRDGRAFTVLGWAQVSQGKGPAAVESFETAIALGDDSNDARRGLARARSRGGQL